MMINFNGFNKNLNYFFIELPFIEFHFIYILRCYNNVVAFSTATFLVNNYCYQLDKEQLYQFISM